jgi:hypothetical protein
MAEQITDACLAAIHDHQRDRVESCSQLVVRSTAPVLVI